MKAFEASIDLMAVSSFDMTEMTSFRDSATMSCPLWVISGRRPKRSPT